MQASSACGLTTGAIRSGLAVDAVPGSLTKNNQNPVIEITVQGKKGKKAACAANKLAKQVVVDKVSAFANQKIANFSQQISLDERQQTLINQALQRGGLSASDQLLLQLRLATVQSDRLSTSQLLLQARQVEQPQILTTAAFQRVTARSRRNVVVVAALIGLVLGILAALAWDRVVPRFVAARVGFLRMLEGKRVAVVVPAHDEEVLVATTIGGIPAFVDRIYVVDDGSTDATGEQARGAGDARVEVVVHERNRGVGAAIVTGYRRAAADGIDVVAVMAADNQMDPADLETLVAPVARGELDYAKANRLFSGQAWQLIPRTRYLGNAVLSMLTKIASGYWHVADSQSGYTAISRAMIEQLDLDRVYSRYGFPNDLLVHLNVWNARVRDFGSRPVYGVGERSGIRYHNVVPRISWLLLRGFFWRLREKYVIRDFHPLVFFYVMGFAATLAGLALGILEVVDRIGGNDVSVGTVVLIALLLISGSQFTLFAMWFDMESNKDLR